jgi:hypothetical protein
MSKQDTRQAAAMKMGWKDSAAMLIFGLVILTVLVAMDRPGWFHLRPATGTATAMSEASVYAPAAARR